VAATNIVLQFAVRRSLFREPCKYLYKPYLARN